MLYKGSGQGPPNRLLADLGGPGAAFPYFLPGQPARCLRYIFIIALPSIGYRMARQETDSKRNKSRKEP
jgi:hypothetical protein